MDAFLLQLGKNIRSLRNERGMTQDELALATGTTRNTIARVERGVQSPSILLLAKMARVFDVRVTTLLRKCKIKI